MIIVLIKWSAEIREHNDNAKTKSDRQSGKASGLANYLNRFIWLEIESQTEYGGSKFNKKSRRGKKQKQ